jgi:hypothetical protein
MVGTLLLGPQKKDFPPFLEQVQFLKDHNASRDEYILLSILYSYEINKIKEGPTEEQLAALINAFNLATSALFVIDNPPNANDQTAGA